MKDGRIYLYLLEACVRSAFGILNTEAGHVPSTYFSRVTSAASRGRLPAGAE